MAPVLEFFGGQREPFRIERNEVIIGRGTTTLRTELPDRGALSGLMERINGLGLDVIDVSLVASPPRR